MKQRTIIVTGGSRGYGRGIASVLKAHGFDVWITGRNQSALESAATGIGVRSVVADAGRPESWDRVMETVGEQSGGIWGLINNAGSAGVIGPLSGLSDEAISSIVQTNLTGVIHGCRRAAALMQQNGDGHVVNISSVCGTYAWPGWSVYSAAKAGLEQFTRCLYAECRPKGVRVSLVIPSWGATDFAETASLEGHPTQDPAVRARCTKPEDLGECVLHILNTPPHLNVLEYTLLPTVQNIEPL